MKKMIRFSKAFLPTAIVSAILIAASVAGVFVKGFNLGVDFQAGLLQEVRFAPTAFSLTWSGRGNATVSFDRSNLYIVVSGAGLDARTITFPFADYENASELAESMEDQAEGLKVTLNTVEEINTSWLIFSAQGNPYLGSLPYPVHYLDPSSPEILIATVREALTSMGQAVSVQSLGQPKDRHFMIRVEDKKMPAKKASNVAVASDAESDADTADASEADEPAINDEAAAYLSESEEGILAEKLISVLEGYFGEGEVVLLRSDYVGSRFSKNLTDQVGLLIALTLLLILAYASIRFKPQYAIAAVIGIVHDALIIIGMVVWTRMEFNTTTIAAILTILGYSINNTIVVFDRIRETRRIYPDAPFVDILDNSLTATLSRSIITTLTTMLAVLALVIFASGTMRDFAIALQVGMVSGVYTSIFIANGFVNFWEDQKIKKEKMKLAAKSADSKNAAKAR
jgi:preprotein translocase subunit SecF